MAKFQGTYQFFIGRDESSLLKEISDRSEEILAMSGDFHRDQRLGQNLWTDRRLLSRCAEAIKTYSRERQERLDAANQHGWLETVPLAPTHYVASHFSIDATRVHGWRKAGILTGVQIGRDWFYSREEIERLKRCGWPQEQGS